MQAPPALAELNDEAALVTEAESLQTTTARPDRESRPPAGRIRRKAAVMLTIKRAEVAPATAPRPEPLSAKPPSECPNLEEFPSRPHLHETIEIDALPHAVEAAGVVRPVDMGTTAWG